MSPWTRRLTLLALIPLATSCAQETYTCCVEGLVETCECPKDANCLTPAIIDNGDGTCQQADTGDSAAGG